MATPQSGAFFVLNMIDFILGKKITQGQSFNQKGERIPQTIIDVSSCYLVGIKSLEAHGYWAIKLGTGFKKNINKPVLGELKQAGIKTPLAFLKEIRLKRPMELRFIEENNKKGIEIIGRKIFIGDAVDPQLFFKVGDKVDVSGISKGKGFQGVVKRHGFAGGPRTHGQSDRERAPGSIGQTTTPGRVYKGKRMAGRMGKNKITIKNLEIIEIKEKQIVVKGLVPGPKKGWLTIKKI